MREEICQRRRSERMDWSFYVRRQDIFFAGKSIIISKRQAERSIIVWVTYRYIKHPQHLSFPIFLHLSNSLSDFTLFHQLPLSNSTVALLCFINSNFHTVKPWQMNFFLQGDFKIQQSWNKKPQSRQSNSRGKSREKQSNKSLVNAGKNIIDTSIPDILDDQVNRYILREFQAEIPPPPSIKSEKKIGQKESNSAMPPRQRFNLPNGNSENQLLTSMASRLKTVEMTNKSLREELKEKNGVIEKIKAENIFFKGFREDSGKTFQKMQEIQKENKDLKQKVQKMQEYLKKYGLKWVGDKLQGKLQQQKIKQAIKKGNYQYRLPSEIDINTIIRRIQELNAGLHSQGMGTEVYQQNGVHKFRKAEPLPIGFFSNGIAIKGYNFFSYQSKESLQILGDLIDGYFPYILKQKYPNGVFMKACDKLTEKYTNQSSDEQINTMDTNANKQFKPPSKEQFLSKLPKSILKNGKVISIRGQIQKRLNGQPNNTIRQEQSDEQNQLYQKSNGTIIFKTQAKSKLDSKKFNEQDIASLKIRNEQGQIFILYLEKQKHMKDVYVWMRKIIKMRNFKVMGNFPRRAYEEDQKVDLEGLGLCPNALLHIQVVAQK